MQEDLQTAYQEILKKKKKDKIDQIILKLIAQEIKDGKLKNYDEVLNENAQNQNFTKILSHSEEGINEIVPPRPENFLYIDGNAIVKDLESLKRLTN